METPLKLTIDKQYLLHEGGTKFYQVLRFLRTEPGLFGTLEKKAATVTHWGSQKGELRQTRVVMHGQSKLVKGDKYAESIGAKKSRGYQVLEIAWGTTISFTDSAKFEAELTTELGATAAGEVMVMLGLRFVADGPTADSDTVSAAEIRSVKEPEPEASSMDDWGAF